MKSNEYEYFASENHVALSEFPLVLTLVCLGFKFTALDQDPKTPQKTEFIFPKSDALTETIAKYWEGNCLVEPKAFWNVSRELKSRMRSEINYGSK